MQENQRTIAKEIRFAGKALQTGKDVTVVCGPCGADEGIVFKRADIEGSPALKAGSIIAADPALRRTTIGSGTAAVQTVEHFLAALWGLGIDNLKVDVIGEELPAMDGSSIGFFNVLKEGGLTEQDSPRHYIKVSEDISICDGDRTLSVYPSESFSVSYLIDYNIPSIGREVYQIELDSFSFEKEIAPARTFCLKSEAEKLLKAGLGKGANMENTLVMDDKGPIGGTTLRFHNEPLRHKILDLVGDLYVLGRPLLGKIVAEKSGHALNGQMVKLLYEKYVKTQDTM